MTTTLLPEDAAPAPEPGPAPADRDRASQWRLVWWRFRGHKLAMAGLVVLSGFYLVALLASFLAPHSTSWFDEDYIYAPPQLPKLVDTSGDDWNWGLFVNGYTMEQDPETLELTHTTDPDTRIELGFFVRGESYSLLGLVDTNVHLFGPKDPDQPVYLLGADHRGRDLLSLIIHGTRVSMTIGLVGVLLAFVLGVVLGGISGYVGGKTDGLIQRVVEFFMSLPTLPLWLGLAAALPRDWGPLQRYFAITVILAIIAWTDLARVVRGRFLSLRTEQFVTAARLDGSTRRRVIFRHMLPSFTSHLVASLTLSIPAMILAETSLSFLGLGLQSPVISWGVLLEQAQNFRAMADAPWLLLPGAAVVLAVLSFNFVGDGLRDAADPYR
ncbi:ABC transporter permease [Jiangella anatolica]|uniref:Peptide ABC transporter permease n=1 Tax=Jiangella anatolica TaxID=2670374 RepID=A0A2W2BEP8_9ACTN|nr:ABC transporter permease [Jiangella anatolica]PZF85595.1 peptide ABC transporter permease [Jiangella anatolica]